MSVQEVQAPQITSVLSLDQEWSKVLSKLCQHLGQATFKSWIEPLKVKDLNSGTLVLAAPNRFMRDWIETHYGQEILTLVRQQNIGVLAVTFIADQADSAKSHLVVENKDFPEEKNSPLEDFIQTVGAPLDPRFTFENFVVGKPNELAYAAALRVAESEKATFNPLFLYGGVGLGKTHLMHGIAWHIRHCHPKRRVLYISAEKFMYQFIRALRFKDTMSFKEQFRSVDVLMIDDVQFISGKDSTQEEFFHTFNALVDQNHQVIVSADKSPSDLEGMEERLRSRLGWGLVADIHPTTYELRLSILQAKMKPDHHHVPKEVLEFLAHRISSNVRELEGAFNRILAHSTLVGRELSVEMAQDVLRDILRANDRRVTIEEIQKKVAEHYSIRLSDMSSAKRQKVIAQTRQIAMYLCKTLTSRSLPEIGRKFGGRDHTTVLHAIRKIEGLISSDPTVAEDIRLLEQMLMT